MILCLEHNTLLPGKSRTNDSTSRATIESNKSTTLQNQLNEVRKVT